MDFKQRSPRRWTKPINDASRRRLLPAILEVYEEAETTMDLPSPAPGLPAAVAALAQTRGRGRTGPWSSPRGGAWLTIIHPGAPPQGLPLAVAGCLARRLQALLPRGAPRVTVKWPNDLMLADAKLAGILVEHRRDETRIGIGVNVYNPAPPGAARLADHGYTGPLLRVHLEAAAAALEAVHSPAGCIAEAISRDHLRGCTVEAVDEKGATVKGRALGIARDAALLLETRGDVRRLHCCHVISYRCPRPS